jgi:hypothetical protein
VRIAGPPSSHRRRPEKSTEILLTA